MGGGGGVRFIDMGGKIIAKACCGADELKIQDNVKRLKFRHNHALQW